MVYRIVLITLLLVLGGCASGGSFKRTEILTSNPRWSKLEDVQSSFEKIVIGVTNKIALRELGFGEGAKNIEKINKRRLKEHFFKKDTSRDSDGFIPEEITTCLHGEKLCYGLIVRVKYLRTTGKESFSSRIMQGKRVDEITGWKFSGTIVLSGDTVIYAKPDSVIEKIYAIKEKTDRGEIFEKLTIPFFFIFFPFK